MSARKRTILLVISGAVLIVAVTFSLLNFLRQAQSESTTTLKSASKSYALQVAATPASRQLGLGKRTSLPTDQGMLFVFSGWPQQQCFWMKDMHFPIDMIWVSSTKRVEHVQTNVSPNTYPHTFCPDVPAKYVIELNAGQATAADIHTGETLRF